MGWDKNSSTGKAKAAHVSKAKQGIQSPLPISRQVFSHLQESRAPSRVTVTWENKLRNSKCPNVPPAPSFSPSFICWAWHHMVWNIPSVRWASCPGCTPSQLLMHSPPSHWQASMTSWKVFDYLETTQNISVLSTLF